MNSLSNADIVRVLNKIADLLEIKGEIQFKVRAYRTAAETVENMGQPLAELVESQGGLAGLEGFGAAMREKMTELVSTGRLTYLEKLETEVPVTLLEIMSLHGVGPKTTSMFWKTAGITTIDELALALESGDLDKLPRMGKKSLDKIRAAVEERLAHGKAERRPRAEVAELVERLLEQLRTLPESERVEVAGSYRRGSATVGDLDILVATQMAPKVLAHFAALPQVEEVQLRGDTKCSVVIGGLQVDCRAVKPEQFGAAWQYFTGSKAHNILVRSRAQKRGLTINEYGIAKIGEEAHSAGASEEELYQAVGMALVPPTERLGGDEISRYELPE